jgi:hypothetical protein
MCLRQPFGSAITALAQTHWHADLFDWISAKFGDDNNVNWRQQANCRSSTSSEGFISSASCRKPASGTNAWKCMVRRLTAREKLIDEKTVWANVFGL